MSWREGPALPSLNGAVTQHRRNERAIIEICALVWLTKVRTLASTNEGHSLLDHVFRDMSDEY